MQHEKKHIKCIPLQTLINQKRLPMLFIGSGISKRYLKNYPNWNELINCLASSVNISESQILAMKQEITDRKPHCPQSEIFKVVGQKITEKLRRDIAEGNIKTSDLFDNEEMQHIKNNNTPFIKMLISKQFKNYELYDSIKLQNEIEELKKLQNNIGVVITTNYDTFIEQLFNNFYCYSEQSQYYMSDAEGIGEIYKIHGCAKKPHTIIFNSEDYDNFENNLRVIVAKILTLLLDYPLIFLGYSLEDANVLNIIYSLMDCLNEHQLSNLSNKLIYVTWKQGENNLICSKKTISKNGKTLTLTNIETDNYYVIYKYLQRFYPCEKPERVRKIKRMIKDLIVKNTYGINTVLTTEENLDQLKDEQKLVIAFGSNTALADKGIVGINVTDLCNKVLKQEVHNVEYCENLIEKCYINNSKIPQNHFVPIFYFTKLTNKFNENEKYVTLKNNILNYVEKLNKNTSIPVLSNSSNIIKQLKTLQKSKVIESLIKSFSLDILDYETYIKTIKTIISDTSFDIQINDTKIRKAITYADLK